MCFGSYCSWSFSCSRSSLTNLSTFFNCSSTSFCSWPCFKNHSFSSHEWWSKSFLVEQILFIWIAWLYGMLFFNDFGCSELMLRKVWRSVFFLNILVCNLLFLMYISVSRNEILSFDISYSNLIDGCFAFYLFKSFSRSLLLPVYIKNILSINLRYIGKWKFTFEGAQIVSMAQSFIWK